MARLCERDTWIMDGNYGSTLAPRLARCDAVVFFDLPRLRCMQGVLQRRLVHHFVPRPDVPPGCPERIDLEFLRWVWNYPRDTRPRVLTALAAAGPEVEILTIARRAQARAILRALAGRRAASPPEATACGG